MPDYPVLDVLSRNQSNNDYFRNWLPNHYIHTYSRVSDRLISLSKSANAGMGVAEMFFV